MGTSSAWCVLSSVRLQCHPFSVNILQINLSTQEVLSLWLCQFVLYKEFFFSISRLLFFAHSTFEWKSAVIETSVAHWAIMVGTSLRVYIKSNRRRLLLLLLWCTEWPSTATQAAVAKSINDDDKLHWIDDNNNDMISCPRLINKQWLLSCVGAGSGDRPVLKPCVASQQHYLPSFGQPSVIYGKMWIQRVVGWVNTATTTRTCLN